MSILGPVREYDSLTAEQRQRAWQTAYLFSLDQHPDKGGDAETMRRLTEARDALSRRLSA